MTTPREAAAETGIAIPILPARDLNETRSFYERLGFRTAGWWPDFGGYASFVRGDITVHFFSFDDVVPGDNYGQCYWRVKDVDALHNEYAALSLPGTGIPRMESVHDRPWGMREFAIVDPSGNLIRIGQQMSVESMKRS